MTAVIGRSRHVTGCATLRLVGGRIQDLLYPDLRRAVGRDDYLDQPQA